MFYQHSTRTYTKVRGSTDKSVKYVLRKGAIKGVLEWFQNNIMQDDNVNDYFNGKQRMVHFFESIGHVLSEPFSSISINDQ